MNDFLNKMKGYKMPGGMKFGPIIVLAILLLVFGSSVFYQVGVDEVGVVRRFGKYVREAQPGLNLKWPMGVEKVTKVPVRRVLNMEFGSSTSQGRFRDTGYRSGRDDIGVSLMLTGDLNVAIVPWVVQYKINDPYDYLFRVNDVDELLRDMSEAVMRLVVGDRSIDEVITKRDEIANEAAALLQVELDNAKSGIKIDLINMKKTEPPPPVQASWNEVNRAEAEKVQTINQAKGDYNKAIPAARGEAERTIQEARGYAKQRINRARGDANRFEAIYLEYAKAKDVTKRRLYLETLGDLLPKMGHKYIVDSEQKNLLPLLNLGKEGGIRK
jgi:membrane protease subunit HflK